MKTLFAITFFITIFSCGNDKKRDQNSSEIDPCNYLTEAYIKALIPEANNFRKETSGSSYPTCFYKFNIGDVESRAMLVVVLGAGKAKNFETSMSYLKNKERIQGLGEEAFYMPNTGQVSTYANKNLIHLTISKDLGHVKGEYKDLTIKAAKKILADL
ncbi:hypothetical protein Q4566_01715 [Tamlana sp. 2_MG-2023]|uniref:hypothetical protein n=1 Tax=unclassified Tamlana TaxID=2614803 RepID=UPI0026E3C56C|nr:MULTISPECIES: hypothetical protein [unclassified Tamlana]MDO6758901.1 hypothetical protein [Tamlana sp. 2_MG-2023]MDO6789600.1 hypothetical protein [Tamlana sp. 1_MG-2023]